MSKFWITIGSLLGFLAVAVGAFGAHGLKNILSPDMKIIFETGNKYHFYHALAILAVGILSRWEMNSNHSKRLKLLQISGWMFFLGVMVFSGSLYTLAITEIRILGAITPLGGVSFLLGWILLAWSYRKF